MTFYWCVGNHMKCLSSAYSLRGWAVFRSPKGDSRHGQWSPFGGGATTNVGQRDGGCRASWNLRGTPERRSPLGLSLPALCQPPTAAVPRSRTGALAWSPPLPVLSLPRLLPAFLAATYRDLNTTHLGPLLRRRYCGQLRSTGRGVCRRFAAGAAQLPAAAQGAIHLDQTQSDLAACLCQGVLTHHLVL